MHRFFATTLLLVLATASGFAAERPNILWLTAEDHGPHLGCYGDTYADTPNLDALAKRGVMFTHAWSNAPVCAPARTCLISGRWAPANGAEHMRSLVPMPEGQKMYPQLLREAGYYCTNNAKEDYNLDKPEEVWDESGRAAHWKNRKPGQPFFAVFNYEDSHESKIRARPHTLVHDMSKATVPPYQPDTSEVRHDWAQYNDNITTIDGRVAKALEELKQEGLEQDTIVFFYADHGAGMPRSKRWPYDSGLHVPFIAHFPEKWKHLAPKGYEAGGKNDELVCFIDMGPTVLSLAGVKPPEYMQGRAFAGEFAAPAPQYIHGFRGRMDERYDLMRSVTDGRYVYARQYMPHLPYGQHVNYMFQQATTRVWHDMFEEGELNAVQSAFWKPKLSEELYDLQSDPWETVNLAGSGEHKEVLERMRKAHREFMLSSRDLGFIPEAERLEHSAGRSPKDAYAAEDAYPMETVLDAADLASDRSKPDAALLKPLLESPNAVIRYWGVIGCQVRGDPAIRAHAPALEQMLSDPSPSVRVAAAEALASCAIAPTVLERCARTLITAANVGNRPYFEAIEALNAIDRVAARLGAYKDQIDALPARAPEQVNARMREYVARLIEHITGKAPAEPAADKAKVRKAKKKANP